MIGMRWQSSTFNDAIVNTTALYDYHVRPLSSMTAWFAAKRAGDFPVLGAIDVDERLMGFASYGPFRAWPANKYTVEHSVYVHRDYRGRGIACSLLQKLIATARGQQYHVLVGGIDIARKSGVFIARNRDIPRNDSGIIDWGNSKRNSLKSGATEVIGYGHAERICSVVVCVWRVSPCPGSGINGSGPVGRLCRY